MIKGWPLILLLYGCSGQPSISSGGIVSNNPCIDAILAEVADPDQITAVSVYSHDTESASAPVDWARQFPALGVSAEEIILAKPRLVLTGNLASSGTNAALKKAGVETVTFGVASTLAEDISQVRLIAKAIDRIAAGEKLVARVKASIPHNGIGLRQNTERPSAIIWQNGGFVAGEGTLQDELLRLHGFRNASSAFGLKSWGVLPLETIIRNPPQFIFMPKSASGEYSRALRARVQLLNHVQNETRIVHFPDQLLYCGGPSVIEVSGILSKSRADFDRQYEMSGA